jgi:predicted metal-dependent hydrolase
MAQHLEGDWLELATTAGSTIRVLKAAHPRARRLRLTVTPTGARVSYPHGTPPAQVSAFLRSHADAAAEADASFALLTLELERLLAKLEEWFGLPRPADA